jgi:hypothetical protein
MYHLQLPELFVDQQLRKENQSQIQFLSGEYFQSTCMLVGTKNLQAKWRLQQELEAFDKGVQSTLQTILSAS